MKLLVVQDEQDKSHKDLAYLLYHEKSQSFYIELMPQADGSCLPWGLEKYVKAGQLTLNSKASKQWVKQRIAAVAKSKNVEAIDEFQFLRLCKGRTEQEGYKLCYICEHKMPEQLRLRLANLVEDVVPLEDYQMLVFFVNGTTRKLSLKELVKEQELAAYQKVEVLAEGFAIGWENIEFTYSELLELGVEIPLSRKDFISFVEYRVLTTCQATELLGCTRQNINYLVDRERITPINKDKRTRLFLKQELLENI